MAGTLRRPGRAVQPEEVAAALPLNGRLPCNGRAHAPSSPRCPPPPLSRFRKAESRVWQERGPARDRSSGQALSKAGGLLFPRLAGWASLRTPPLSSTPRPSPWAKQGFHQVDGRSDKGRALGPESGAARPSRRSVATG